MALVTGLASQEERWLALQLLRAADDGELGGIFGRGSTLLAVLEEGIPAGHALRPELDSFFDQRFSGGRAAVAAGQVVPRGQPAGAFTPALLDASLAGLGLAAEPTPAQLCGITEVIARWNADRLAAGLLTLSGAQRSRAARWLTTVRVLAHQDPGSPPRALVTLDRVLDRLYRAAALDVPDADRLRQLTIAASGRAGAAAAPGAGSALARVRGQHRSTRLSHSPTSSPDSQGTSPPGFARPTKTTSGHGSGVMARVPEGRSGGCRGAGTPWSTSGRSGWRPSEWTDGTFGAFARGAALVPDRPGIPGNIHDQYASLDQRIETMTPAGRRALAGTQLRKYLGWPTRVAARDAGAPRRSRVRAAANR